MSNSSELNFPNLDYESSPKIVSDIQKNIGIHAVDAANRVYEMIMNAEKRAEEAEKNSFEDALTGCHNRRFFEYFKDKMFDHENGHNDIGLAFFDVNNLKEVNDTLGHHMGDVLIKKAAKFLKSIFGKNDIIVRHGGDEFIAICLNDTNNENFEKDLSFRLDGVLKNSPVSMAFGVAVFDENIDLTGLDATEKRSDCLMKENKKKMKSAR